MGIDGRRADGRTEAGRDGRTVGGREGVRNVILPACHHLTTPPPCPPPPANKDLESAVKVSVESKGPNVDVEQVEDYISSPKTAFAMALTDRCLIKPVRGTKRSQLQSTVKSRYVYVARGC